MVPVLCTVIGCGDCSNNGDQTPEPDAGVMPVPRPDASTQQGCEPSDIDGPIVALERNDRVDTFLWPGEREADLVVDYDVVPRAITERLRIFDDSAEEPTETIEETCPGELSLSALGSGALRVARVAADDGEGGDIREGRVYYPDGPHTIDIALPELEGEGWVALVEPATSPARLAVLPIDEEARTAGSIAVAGVPDEAAAVAVVRDPALFSDTEHAVTWAPADWASNWRRSATDWYGTLRFAGSTDAASVMPRRIEGGTDETFHLGAEQPLDLAEFADADRLILLGIGRDITTTLTHDCEDAPRIEIASFAEVTVAPDTDDAATYAPGDVIDLTDESCSGTGEVNLEISSLNSRNPTLVLTRGGEQ
jgi:hypothetical protein